MFSINGGNFYILVILRAQNIFLRNQQALPYEFILAKRYGYTGAFFCTGWSYCLRFVPICYTSILSYRIPNITYSICSLLYFWAKVFDCGQGFETSNISESFSVFNNSKIVFLFNVCCFLCRGDS